jgi:serine protease Do
MNKQRIMSVSRILAVGVIALAVGLFAGARISSEHSAFAMAPAPAAIIPGSIDTGFASIVEKDLPAVVNISSSKVVRNSGGGNVSPFLQGPFFRQFFGDRFGRVPDKQWEHSLGSGVIVSSDGYLLTNNHVIDSATDITVTLSDKRELKAKVVGADPKTDIAVLKVDAKDLYALPLADSSKARVGDVVLAMGNPFGLGQTVTMGIISAKGRAGLGIEDYEDFIQTDAAVNPGNSGGPLIDTHGDLIAINTAILSGRSGGNQGVGFAVPSNMARNVMNQVREHGKVVRGYLGVLPENITPAMGNALHLSDTRGVLIGDVTAGTPAASAGIQRGDVIVEMDNQKITESNQLRLAVADKAPGDTVHLKLLRNGVEQTVAVKLGEQPPSKEQREESGASGSASNARDGVSVENLDADTLRELNLPPMTKGVVVVDVADGSPAAVAGLRSGDVILEVDRSPVANVSEFDRALRNGAGRTVLILLNRGGSTLFIAIEPR